MSGISALIIMMLLFASCKEEVINPGKDVEHTDNLPVDIQAFLPASTRAVNAKTEFEDGNIIHIEGTFHMDDDTDEIKYGAFRYEGGNWRQYGGEQGSINVVGFTWPNNCVTAEFKAYYVNGVTSFLSPTDSPENNPATLLSSLAGENNQPDTDPLVATSSGSVKYGHTIVLNFIHACAYLTVEEMPAGINTFWFTQQQDNGTVSDNFKNAYKFWLDNYNNLHFDFVQAPDAQYGGEIYVSGSAKSEFLEGVEKANFGVFLAPGQYDNFVIGYPGATSMVKYLSYQKKGPNIGPNGETDPNPDNIMVENCVYTFNISRSAGLQITSPPGSDGWNEEEDPIYDVDAEKFLYSICYPADYFVEYDGEDVKILEQVGNGTRLLKNVNMQWAEYNVFSPSEANEQKWFIPDLGRGNLFDGNYHYIWNLGSPLFNTIDGTIKNLGITNVNFSITTQDQFKPENYTPGTNDPDYFDLSRAGALCNYVQEGTVQNIRVRAKLPVKETFDPDSYQPDSGMPYYQNIFNMSVTTYTERDSEAHNIGCVIGSNLNGTIMDITIMCDMNLTVSSSSESTYTDPTLSIGGIIGQNVNIITGIGTDNSLLDGKAPKISIINKCTDQNAAYYIGGILGYHSGGTVNNAILPSINIESRESVGFNSYIGGAVGGLSNRSDGGELLNCSVSGQVYAGKSETHSEFMASNYIGGLAGECYESYTVNGCQCVIKVIGPYNSQDGTYNNYINNGTVAYGVGGVFGIIQRLNNSNQSPANIGNIIGYGDALQGPPSIGNFAGIVPADETWENNYASSGIQVKVHSNVNKYIGSQE